MVLNRALSFREVNPSVEMGVGKAFVVGYKIPWYGEYKFLAHISQWEPGR